MKSGQSVSIVKDFSWTLLSNLIYAATQWGILVMLARLGTPETVGRFSLALAICSPVILLANLKLRTVQVTDAKEEYSFSEYANLRVITTMVAMLVIAGITLVSGYTWETMLVVLVMAVAKAFESFSDIYHGQFQKRLLFNTIAKSMILRGILSFIILTIVLYLTKSLVWAVVGMTLVWGLVFFFCDFRTGKQLDLDVKFSWSMTKILNLAWVALPLGFAVMINSLNTNIPRYFIQNHLGEHALGIFAAMAYLLVVGNTVINALGQSASPRLAKLYQTGNMSGFFRLLAKLVAMGIGLGLAGVIVTYFFGAEILTLIYGAEYAQQADIFVILMMTGAVTYSFVFVGTALGAMQKYKVQAPINLISNLVVLVLSTFAIAAFGLKGAAWSLFGCELSLGLGYLIVVWYTWKKEGARYLAARRNEATDQTL
ncbi:oligosaccharide flippase family protein [Brevibacillus dissolubilis]|uniref:oligosaccharide flippase family protein n=1 Tax=Brevibacillus dissolubilis TaxID=1844116 RepID=UPI00159BE8CA|nr:oligosaccharide flippase family protein [Brevibacillus dissolubilis]